MTVPKELAPEDLRCNCAPGLFDFKTTASLAPLTEVIGQQRAVQAITFGLNMRSPGYNIFVSGQEGTGKSTIVTDIVTRFARQQPPPGDWCLVNNFDDPYQPKAIALGAGQAMGFKRRMNRLVDHLTVALPQTLDDDIFQEQQTNLRQKYAAQQQTLFKKVEQAAAQKDINLQKTQAGYQTVVLAEGQPLTEEQFTQLPAEQQTQIKSRLAAVQKQLAATLNDVRKLSRQLEAALEQMAADAARQVIDERMAPLRRDYKDYPLLLNFLDDVRNDLIDQIDAFRGAAEPPANAAGPMVRTTAAPTDNYQVNVLVDQRGRQGAPVIFEANPTFPNIFGQIEKRAVMGGWTTDYTLVQAGSLLRANGGYLIMEIEAILLNPPVWEVLKRALQNKRLFIEDTPGGMGTAALRPQPIPLDVKIVLLGNPEMFNRLQNFDAKFNKIFKVRADFDYEAPRTDETIQHYARFVARVCAEEKLLPFTPDGVAAVVEYAVKYSANQNKLSLRFGPIVGVIKEADYWARQAGADVIDNTLVVKAFQEYRFRYNLYEEKIHESYLDDTILIDVASRAVGQVNALAVYQMGEIAFGRPSRITAEAFMGKDGIINIEREADLSGKTHNKGVLILAGYLGRVFAQQHPLNLSVSITFEQHYSGIDGDSASSTELYAILSSLADVPINQGLAVTGSVNQKGQVQAIGGVNQKIEGFFDVCRAKGLTGAQGVLIPHANVKNLMLKKEVIDAVKQKQFHIYPVTTIETGMEILTGQAAGQADTSGQFPDNSLYGKVQTRLKTYYERSLASIRK